MKTVHLAALTAALCAGGGFAVAGPVASVAGAARSASACHIDGDYVHANSERERRVEILSIRGTHATVFEREPRRDVFGRVHEPVRWVGAAVHQERYLVRTAPAVNGQRSFDLVTPSRGGQGYSGFDFDCATRQVFHPSVGDWIRFNGYR